MFITFASNVESGRYITLITIHYWCKYVLFSNSRLSSFLQTHSLPLVLTLIVCVRGYYLSFFSFSSPSCINSQFWSNIFLILIACCMFLSLSLSLSLSLLSLLLHHLFVFDVVLVHHWYIFNVVVSSSSLRVKWEVYAIYPIC